MKSTQPFRFTYVFFLAAVFLNNVFSQSATPTPEVVAPVVVTPAVAEENLIHSGDLIDVDIVGSTEFDWRGNLDSDGFLSNVNFSETPIYALCETEEAVAAKVVDSYRKILRDPKVIVKILDRTNRPLAVLYGAVKKNQRFQIKRFVSLSEIIIISGGFTEQVSGEIEIFRPRNLNCSEKKIDIKTTGDDAAQTAAKPVSSAVQPTNIKISDLLSGDARFNPQILGGDIITVSEAKPLYIIGGVVAPKQIPVRAELTLSRAIDSVGGLSKDADTAEIRIFRRSGFETKSIVANLDKIRAGQAADVNLQPFDVIEVPITGGGRKDFSPVVKEFVISEKQSEKLPLTVVD